MDLRLPLGKAMSRCGTRTHAHPASVSSLLAVPPSGGPQRDRRRLISGRTSSITLSSAITLTIQARQTDRAALKKRAIELALEDYRFRVNDKTGRVAVVPVSALIYYYDKLIDLAARDRLDGPNLQALLRDQWQLQLAADAEAERLRASQEPPRS